MKTLYIDEKYENEEDEELLYESVMLEIPIPEKYRSVPDYEKWREVPFKKNKEHIERNSSMALALLRCCKNFNRELFSSNTEIEILF